MSHAEGEKAAEEENMRTRIALSILFVLVSSRAFGGGAVVREACGANAASIQATVDQFRTDLGALNPNVAGSFPSGRREINWDGVPDAFSAPNNLPANFFNVNSPRGVVFSTPGTGFQVSANAGVAPIEFDNINLTYSATFTTFSPQRLFTALGSNVLDVTFFVPGSTTPATTSGFGAVFTDVDVASATSIQYFDSLNVSLGTFTLNSSSSGGLCFLGVFFTAGERVARVRITSGNTALGVNDAPPTQDVVAMDDFIYAEPQGLVTPTPTVTRTATATATPTATPTTVAPTATPTIIGGGGPAPGTIPTLSAGMLALLAAALGATAVLLIRRQ